MLVKVFYEVIKIVEVMKLNKILLATIVVSGNKGTQVCRIAR
jgi:hypothetical protein